MTPEQVKKELQAMATELSMEAYQQGFTDGVTGLATSFLETVQDIQTYSSGEERIKQQVVSMLMSLKRAKI